MNVVVKMKHFLIMLWLMAVNADDNGRCEGIVYRGINYDKNVLKTNVQFSSTMANTLYLFYDKHSAPGIATLNLNTLEFHSAELKDMFATSAAFDLKSKIVFLGTHSGVYKYDITNNKVDFYAVDNTTIASLFFKDGVLYFTKLSTGALYTIENGVVSLFKDLENIHVYNFFIFKDDIYFTNRTGLYSQKKGTKDAVYYEGSNVGWIEGLAADINGNVFACLKDGIYAVVKPGHTLIKQLPVYMPNSLAFDDNNDMIYSTASDIVRITLSKDQGCVSNEL